MPATGIRAAGLDKVRRALKASGDDLADLKATNREVSDFIATRAAPGMPHRSGRLVSSMRSGAAASKATIKVGSAGVPYAGPILFGWPARNIRPAQVTPYGVALDTQEQWMDLYWTRITAILEKIKGV